MVQNAIVKKVVRDGVAEVSLLRQMECGLHCDGACAGCAQKPAEEILALASNPIGAKPGDLVEVAPTGGGNLTVPLVVFLVPCLCLALGYGLGQSVLGLGEGAALLTALAGLVIGFLPAILLNRAIQARKAPEFHIQKFLR